MQLNYITESGRVDIDQPAMQTLLEKFVRQRYKIEIVPYRFETTDAIQATVYFELGADIAEIKEFTNILSTFLNKRGWELIGLSKDYRSHSVEYETWGLTVAPVIGVLVDPDNLYHVSPIANGARIVAKGLIPTVGNNSFGITKRRDRVYCHTDVDDAVMMATQFSKRSRSGYDVYVINKSELNRNTKFYRDPEDPITAKFVFTYTHIPKMAISKLVTISSHQDEIYVAADPLKTALAIQSREQL